MASDAMVPGQFYPEQFDLSVAAGQMRAMREQARATADQVKRATTGLKQGVGQALAPAASVYTVSLRQQEQARRAAQQTAAAQQQASESAAAQWRAISSASSEGFGNFSRAAQRTGEAGQMGNSQLISAQVQPLAGGFAGALGDIMRPGRRLPSGMIFSRMMSEQAIGLVQREFSSLMTGGSGVLSTALTGGEGLTGLAGRHPAVGGMIDQLQQFRSGGGLLGSALGLGANAPNASAAQALEGMYGEGTYGQAGALGAGDAGELGSAVSEAFTQATPALSTAMQTSFQDSSGVLSSLFGSVLGMTGGGVGGESGGGLGAVGSLFSGALSVDSLFGFARGGIVPSAAGGMIVGAGHGTLAMLHPREMVLPSHISTGLQRMVGGAANTGPTASHNLNVNYHVNALDARSVRGLLEEHGGTIANVLQRQLRNSPRGGSGFQVT